MSWLAGLWRNHRAAVLVAGVLAAAGLAIAFIWPFTDLIAQHDAGLIIGPQRAPQLQAAREAVRTQLLTLGAGLLAAGALAFTAWNVTLYRSNLTLYRQTNELTEQGQVTDRYTKATEQLGSDKLDVCIGGIYALERIACDSPRDQPTVIEVLSAYIREHSPEPWPPADHPASRERERLTRPDVQAALTVVGRRDVRRDVRPINLIYANLPSADLTGANLGGANLTGADLSNAYLGSADLGGANLVGAHLGVADLKDAALARANLSAADLTNADLTNADLTEANLTHAAFTNANLTHAVLTCADLTGAYLVGAKLTGANLTRADLTGVALSDTLRGNLSPTHVDLAAADLTGARWAEDARVPQGWKLDTGSGRLVEARPDPGPA